MKAYPTIFLGCLIGILAPAPATAQDYHPAVYTYNENVSPVSSNVPLNQINSHAFRHFLRRFPAGTSSEYWFVSAEGSQVSFQLAGRHHLAFFDKHGGFRYSLQYYPGKEIPRVSGDLVKAKYPGFQIDVVTEITDGVKTFYLVNIVNPNNVLTLSVADGKIDVLEDLINGASTAANRP